jgi:hypothetical protein
MSIPDPGLEARLRRAYESGRLRAATLAALPLLPLIALACSCCASPAQVVLIGAALVGTVVALRWRGEQFGAGVTPGIFAGLGPLVVPVAGRLGAPMCGVAGCDVTPSICALGGLLGGVLLGFLAPPPGAGRTVPFVVACLVAALTGAVGCLMYGLVGLAVMAGGLLLGAVPLVAVRRA